jgi:hypothetical protein
MIDSCYLFNAITKIMWHLTVAVLWICWLINGARRILQWEKTFIVVFNVMDHVAEQYRCEGDTASSFVCGSVRVRLAYR